MPQPQPMQRLEADAAATFVITADGRIARENDPEHSPGPRLFVAGGEGGTIVHARHDVGDETVRRVLARLAPEPPWRDPDTPPPWLADIVDLMARESPVASVTSAVIHDLPHGRIYKAGARIVSGDTPEGERLLARLAADGMPPALRAAGFASVDDFWKPWRVAVEGEAIAAIAFAARLGPRAAEIGVYSLPGFRGRGLAAAVTASWSCLPSLARRQLFYSAHASNASSRQVARRLGLPHLGASLRIA